MHTTRVHRVIVAVADVASAATDFAHAFGVTFNAERDPISGVAMLASEVITLVSASDRALAGPSGDAWRGPLVAVELAVSDVGAVRAALERTRTTVVAEIDAALATTPFHGLPLRVVCADDVGDAGAAGTVSRFDRAVLAVDDIRAAADDLEAAFGLALQVFEVENMRIRVGLGEAGIEFIDKMPGEVEIAQHWNPPITGFAVQVDDLDAAKERFARLGATVTFEFTTPGGSPEVYYGNPGLHGIPITLIPWHDEGGLLESMGIEDGAADVSPTAIR